MEEIFNNAKIVILESLKTAALSFLDDLIVKMDKVHFGVFNEAIKSLVKFLVLALKKYLVSVMVVDQPPIAGPVLRF